MFGCCCLFVLWNTEGLSLTKNFKIISTLSCNEAQTIIDALKICLKDVIDMDKDHIKQLLKETHKFLCSVVIKVKRKTHHTSIHMFVHYYIEKLQYLYHVKYTYLSYRGFPTRMVYLYYISCLRYTILVGNPQIIDLYLRLPHIL